MKTLAAGLETKRRIGSYGQKGTGELMIFLACIHGNESSGYYALKDIFALLEKEQPAFKGEMVGLLGNIPACRAGRRMLDCDMNRIWIEDMIHRINALPDEKLNNEEQQLKVLLQTLESVTEGYDPKDVIVVDLHETSSPGGLFTISDKNPDNLEIAHAVGVPVLDDLMDVLHGTSIFHMYSKGFRSIGFEGGSIHDDSSRDMHEAGIWMLLESRGMIQQDHIPNYDTYKQALDDAAGHLPQMTRVDYVHRIHRGDGFIMDPGYANFTKVTKGQRLAEDSHGVIYAPITGLILMPLYQDEGSEGFFIIRDDE